MKKNAWTVISMALSLCALLIVIGVMTGWVQGKPRQQSGGAPGMVSYQGRVLVSDAPYEGTGYFKFAIVGNEPSGLASYWSNDGTSVDGAEPTASISLAVQQGLFSVLLGDTSLTGMDVALGADTFINPETWLRVWFSEDDASFTQLSDQKIAAVPYALQAASALDADALGGVAAAGWQLVVADTCPVGYAVREVNPDGSVTCEVVEARPGFVITSHTETGDKPGMTIGVDGLGLIAFAQVPNQDLAVGHCDDIACTSMTVTSFATPEADGVFASIAIGADGFGLIAYARYRGGAGWDTVMVSHCLDIACTSVETYQVDAGSKLGYYISLAIGADGNGLIAYADFDSPWKVKAAHCNDVSCSSSTVNVVNQSISFVGRNVSLAIGADGKALISYSDYGGENLHVTHCNDVACSSSSFTTLDTTGNVGGQNSIAIGTDGLGLVAYSGDGKLKVLHCANTACTAATHLTVLDASASLDLSGTSITIGSDGLGIIAYWDSASAALKTAHCKDVLCTAADLHTLDGLAQGSGDQGMGITIGSDGLPMVAYVYYDGSQHILKTVHCSNNFCVPYSKNR